MNVSRTSIQYSLFNKLSPAQLLSLSYLACVIVGTALLRTNAATVGDPLVWIDAMFMATSALCVTGLSVVSIATEFTLFGQLVVLGLIQVGALGVMTMSTMFAMFLGRKIGLRNRMFLQEDLNQNYLSGVVRLVRYVFVLTAVVEVVGAVLLFFLWLPGMEPTDAIYNAIFHSVSAFGNAGFDLFGNSMEGFALQGGPILVIASLFILGGLGFVVIYELLHYKEEQHLSLHSRIVLASTLALIIVAWVFLLIAEFHNPQTLGNLPFSSKIWTAFFTAVTPRTAGFSVVPTSSLHVGSLFFIMILMFIGASPGSTGGGIKTTTLVAVLLGTWATITGKRDVEVGNRRLPHDHVGKALAILILAGFWVLIVAMVLLFTEDMGFMALLFETVSAFGTVGLSMGITADLSESARILLVVTMFIGRLGPMTLALALGQRTSNHSQLRLPKEKVSLG